MTEPATIRSIRETLGKLFAEGKGEDVPETLGRIPLQKAVNAIFPFFYSHEPRIFWQAVTAMGAAVSRMADENSEAARNVMRRLMWSMNEESGGIGWGAAEAMGEIMARHEGLAGEYASILISYINPSGNYIDHPELQKGILWALGRLAQKRPRQAGAAAAFLEPFFSSPDPGLRGLAAWISTLLSDEATKPLRIRLTNDNEVIPLFINGKLCACTIASLAQPHP